MTILYVLVAIIAVYFSLVFVVLRLIVPFMGFGRFTMPQRIPQNIQDAIKELEATSQNPKEYLRAAYNLVVSKWHAARFATVLHVSSAFRTDLDTLWNSPGFAHCHTQNYILFVLLAGSKYFKELDVKPKVVFFNFFIHQYLQVKVENQIINVDPAGASIRGKPLGEHIKWFG